MGYAAGFAVAGVLYQRARVHLRPRFAAVCRWPLCKLLCVRDCTACDNVIVREYLATNSAKL